MRHSARVLRDESGVVLPLVVLMLVALLGLVALAVDHGMGRKARFEAQRAADAAALAGASGIIDAPPGDATQVYLRGRQYAGLNTIMQAAINPLDADQVQLDLLANPTGGAPDPNGVRATIRRRAIPTWFARIFAINSIDVAGVAEARVAGSGTGNCYKPFAIPDNGYGPEDWGQLTLIWQVQDSSLVLIGFDGSPAGLGNLQPYIASTCPSGSVITVGQEVINAAPDNNRNGQIRNGMQDLLNCDPNLTYTDGVGFNREDWRSSCRVGTVAVYDPSTYQPGGTDQVTISNFLTVYFSHATGGGNNYQVYGRVFPLVGIPDSCAATNSCAPNAFIVRLTG